METQEIIEKYLKPRVRSECERLKIPSSFVKGLLARSEEDMIDYWGIVYNARLHNVYDENGKLIGVEIWFKDGIKSKIKMLLLFFHEMDHVKDKYYGKMTSESRATCYSWKRLLQELLTLKILK